MPLPQFLRLKRRTRATIERRTAIRILSRVVMPPQRRKTHGEQTNRCTIFTTAVSTRGEWAPPAGRCACQCACRLAAHPLAGSAGSDCRRHGAAQNHWYASGLRPLYMGGHGVHVGIHYYDPYCRKALRSVRAQVVLDCWDCHLSAGFSAFWGL